MLFLPRVLSFTGSDALLGAGVPVCLQHCATSALLCLEPHTYPNEFGADRELSFKTVKSNGKKLLLVHEAQGELSALLPPTQPLENQFRFVVGSTVKELPLPKCARVCVHGTECMLYQSNRAPACRRQLWQRAYRTQFDGSHELQLAGQTRSRSTTHWRASTRRCCDPALATLASVKSCCAWT